MEGLRDGMGGQREANERWWRMKRNVKERGIRMEEKGRGEGGEENSGSLRGNKVTGRRERKVKRGGEDKSLRKRREGRGRRREEGEEGREGRVVFRVW